MTRSRQAGVALASLALMGTVAGCGASPSTTPSAKGNQGGTVVVAEAPLSAPNWFFPIIASSASSNTNIQTDSIMYKMLLHITNKDTVDYSRSLASGITASSNGRVYTITLNPKYHWSNGTPVTASDFVFTWNLFKAASSGAKGLPWSYAWSGIGGLPQDWGQAVAVNAHTVKVTLTRSVSPTWFILNGLGQISPVPKAVWDKYPHNVDQELSFIQSVANSPTAPEYRVVDGPFKIQSATANQEWVFAPNTAYDGHRARIAKLIFQYETSTTSEFTGLKNGTVSVGYLDSQLWNSRNQLTNDRMSMPYVLGFDYLAPNLSPSAPGGVGKAFQKLYVRQALEMGINQAGIIKTLFHGYGVVGTSPVASLPKTAFTDPALAHALYPFNPSRGKKLLLAHGWQLNNGVMTKNGIALKFTLLYMAGVPTWTNLVELLKSAWAQEGIQVNLKPEPFSNVIGTASQSDPTQWQMAFWGGGWTYEPDYFPSGDGLLNTGGGTNTGGYASATMDQLINATTNLTGTAHQVQQRMFAYEAYAAKQLPVLYLPWNPSSYVGTGLFPEHAQNVHGTVKTFNQVTDLYYPNWWTVSP